MRSNVLLVTVKPKVVVRRVTARVVRLELVGPRSVVAGSTARFTVRVVLSRPLPEDVKYCGGVYVDGRRVAAYCVEVRANHGVGVGGFELYFGKAGTYRVWVEGPDTVSVEERVEVPIIRPPRPLPVPVIL